MKQMNFFKTFWASFLAFIVAGGALLVFAILALIGCLATLNFSSNTIEVSSNSVLKIDFKTPFVESAEFPSFNSIDFKTLSINYDITIIDILSTLEYAMQDPKIKGIYLDFNAPLNMSFAMVEELRDALLKFKLSGKFIVAYGDYYSQGALLLASVSDKIFLNPEGSLEWKGLSINQLFYKGLLDKLDIEPIVLRSGSYKSAIEPFTLKGMSVENKMQNERLATSLWMTMLAEIAKSRDIPENTLQIYANDLSIVYPEDALDAKLVDRLCYFDEFVEEINSNYKEPKFISLKKYLPRVKMTQRESENTIAVIFVDGQITSGKSEQGSVGSESFAKKIQKVKDNDKVKALVLRVNSPGGSALASEVMWREVEQLKEKMPVIVSMGGVAASGGYYISAPADVVLASRMTITGSIGVFSLMFNAGEGLDKKLGITSDGVKTATSADMGTALRAPSKAELAFGEKQVERVYNTFQKRVATGRELNDKQMERVNEGRVFSGMEALNNGLVDGIGGLSKAILFAEQKAELFGDFKLWQVFEKEDNFIFMLQTMGSSMAKTKLRGELQGSFESYQRMQTILQTQGVQAVTPYIYELQ